MKEVLYQNLEEKGSNSQKESSREGESNGGAVRSSSSGSASSLARGESGETSRVGIRSSHGRVEVTSGGASSFVGAVNSNTSSGGGSEGRAILASIGLDASQESS